ncbi:hypothetical protein ACRALDRAFT_211002 [Sodiomyces alcalophilus JCM 7366]|uniref:uncharacterized protein n=1 Tax=Sodiomyces alcalophilus JCM 7366 TaxID=591952 RepID=UPI0039B6182C
MRLTKVQCPIHRLFSSFLTRAETEIDPPFSSVNDKAGPEAEEKKETNPYADIGDTATADSLQYLTITVATHPLQRQTGSHTIDLPSVPDFVRSATWLTRTPFHVRVSNDCVTARQCVLCILCGHLTICLSPTNQLAVKGDIRFAYFLPARHQSVLLPRKLGTDFIFIYFGTDHSQIARLSSVNEKRKKYIPRKMIPALTGNAIGDPAIGNRCPKSHHPTSQFTPDRSDGKAYNVPMTPGFTQVHCFFSLFPKKLAPGLSPALAVHLLNHPFSFESPHVLISTILWWGGDQGKPQALSLGRHTFPWLSFPAKFMSLQVSPRPMAGPCLAC